jgi:hypothetical protein
MKNFRKPLYILIGVIVLASAIITAGVVTQKSNAKKAIQSAPLAKNAANAPSTEGYKGTIINAKTKKPIADASVTLGDKVVRTNEEGQFTIKGNGELLRVKAPSYLRLDYPLSKLDNKTPITMTPIKVKGLYLTVYGVSSTKIKEAALKVLKKNNMNALVIDVKGDRGFIPFTVDLPLAKEIGAQDTILIKDMPGLLASLKAQGIYLIGRIVVFKDDKLAGARPQWSVRKGGDFFRDREHLRWVDPFRKEVWNYNIAIAKAAAKLGFDEIQFDYVRCPDNKGVTFSKPSTMATRTEAITGFLTSANKALTPHNVLVGADIFGYVSWNTDDTGIGQDINKVVDAVDIISPMLYPSGFQFGIPNYRNPVQHSYEIIYLTLKQAQDRAKVPASRFRPWLQAFRDYAFHGGDFGEARMRLQIKASNDFGANGYMFWNPRNVYPDQKFDQ